MKYFKNPELYGVKDEDGNYNYVIGIDELKETPQILSWQDFNWPIIDGDFGIYLMPAGQKELDELSDDNNGLSFIKKWLDDSNITAETIWGSLKKGYITENGIVDTNWPALLHIFKSTKTNKYRLVWDIL